MSIARTIKRNKFLPRFSRRSSTAGSTAVAAKINELLDREPDEVRDRAEIAAVASGPDQTEAGLRTLAAWRQIGGSR